VFVVIVVIWWCGNVTVHYLTIITVTTNATNPNHTQFRLQYYDEAHLTLRNQYSSYQAQHKTKGYLTFIAWILNSNVAVDSQELFLF
jgi:hypothetical protein